MKTKVSHIATVKQNQQTTKQQVETLLNWTKLEYCNFQFEMGLRYLNLELEQDSVAVKKVSQTALFWAWWRNHWAMRDKEFLNRTKFTQNEWVYKAFNDPETIQFSSSNPHLKRSYMQMASKLNAYA